MNEQISRCLGRRARALANRCSNGDVLCIITGYVNHHAPSVMWEHLQLVSHKSRLKTVIMLRVFVLCVLATTVHGLINQQCVRDTDCRGHSGH